MDFHELEAFVALARTLHFAKAAATVNTSPSGLSRLLGRLEDELGVRLADRDTRSVELTDDGLAFLSFAQESLQRRDDMRLGLGARDGRLRGFLRVYASVTACYSIVPPLAKALASEYPELSLSVETGDPAGAEEAVREGRAELAVAALPEGGATGLDSFSIKRTPLVFVSARGGPFEGLDMSARRLPIALATTPLILPRTGLARERFDRWTRLHDVRPRVAAETAGNEAILALARLGIGLGLVPRIVMDMGPLADGLSPHEPDDPGVFGDYDLGYLMRPRGVGPESTRRLRAAVSAVMERTYATGRWVSRAPLAEPGRVRP